MGKGRSEGGEGCELASFFLSLSLPSSRHAHLSPLFCFVSHGVLSILSLLPNTSFFIFALLRIYFLRSKPSRLLHPFDFLLAFKLVLALLLVASSATTLALFKGVEGMPGTTMGACAMGLVAAVSLDVKRDE